MASECSCGDRICPWCGQYNGNHQPSCPFHADNVNNPICRAQFGWQCPKCGTIYSPMIMQCDCSKYTKYTITGETTTSGA